MPPGTLEILLALAGAAFILVLLLTPAYEAGRDVSGAVDVTATRTSEGVAVRLARFPLTRGVLVRSVGVSRELADEMGLDVPAEMRVSLDRRWLSAEGRIRLGEPVDLFFPAKRRAGRPVTGQVRVLSFYRPGIRRIRHYVQVNVEAG